MKESSVSPYGVAAGECVAHPPTHMVERWQRVAKLKEEGDGVDAIPLGGRVYRLTKLVEKPTIEFARENLVTPGLGPEKNGREGRHLVVFGQYILPSRRTFGILAEDIKADRRERCVMNVTLARNAWCARVCVSLLCWLLRVSPIAFAMIRTHG